MAILQTFIKSVIAALFILLTSANRELITLRCKIKLDVVRVLA